MEHVAQVGLDGLLAEKQRRGDLGVGPAVDDEPRDLQLARREGSDPGRVRLARARAAVDLAAELPQLLLGRGPVPRRRRRSRTRRPRAPARPPPGPARRPAASARPASAAPSPRSSAAPTVLQHRRARRARGRPRAPDRRRRARRPHAASAAIAVAIGSPISSAQAGRRRGGALGLGAPAGGELAARQQLERDRPPAARDQPQLLAPDRRHEQVGRRSGAAGLEQRRRPAPRRRGRRACPRRGPWRSRRSAPRWRGRAATSPAAIAANVRLKRFQATPCRLSTSRAASTAPSNTSPDSAMRPCIHSAVPEHRVDEREEIALPGGAADVQRPLGVAARRLEVVEVHLRGRQVHERVEAPGQLVVGDRSISAAASSRVPAPRG